jgi:hypothetical protein
MPLRTVTPTTRRTTASIPQRLRTEIAGLPERPAMGRGTEDTQQLYVLVEKMLAGKLNNTAEVTLAVDPATTTVFSDPRILASSVVLFSPTTATAAAALATTYVTAAQGSVTFTHAASVAADRTFRIAVFA